MSLNNFIPTVWAGKLLQNLNDAHVYVSCLNRDYQGDINAAGDSVKINSIGRVTIGTYTKNTDIAAVETLDDSQMMLVIDHQRYFNFQIDDVDAAQQKPKVMAEAMKEAAWGLADSIDAAVATALEAGVATASPDNTLTAATSVGTGATDDDAYEILVDLMVRLDQSNVNRDGRWAVVPPWFNGMLCKDPRFVSFGTQENRENLKNGAVGIGKTIAGLTVYMSNNVPLTSTEYTIIAGHPQAATYAESIPAGNVEAYRPQLRFGDAMKGLHVAGYKVTRPFALASIVATQAT